MYFLLRLTYITNRNNIIITGITSGHKRSSSSTTLDPAAGKRPRASTGLGSEQNSLTSSDDDTDGEGNDDETDAMNTDGDCSSPEAKPVVTYAQYHAGGTWVDVGESASAAVAASSGNFKDLVDEFVSSIKKKINKPGRNSDVCQFRYQFPQVDLSKQILDERRLHLSFRSLFVVAPQKQLGVSNPDCPYCLLRGDGAARKMIAKDLGGRYGARRVCPGDYILSQRYKLSQECQKSCVPTDSDLEAKRPKELAEVAAWGQLWGKQTFWAHSPVVMRQLPASYRELYRAHVTITDSATAWRTSEYDKCKALAASGVPWTDIARQIREPNWQRFHRIYIALRGDKPVTLSQPSMMEQRVRCLKPHSRWGYYSPDHTTIQRALQREWDIQEAQVHRLAMQGLGCVPHTPHFTAHFALCTMHATQCSCSTPHFTPPQWSVCCCCLL
jgi:hypothetical protein